jgi:hypothetical protein
MEKLQWFETFKVDENIEDDILSTMNKLTEEFKKAKKQNE